MEFYMSLQTKLAEFFTSFTQKVPEAIQAKMAAATESLLQSQITDNIIQVGEKLPYFELPNQNKEMINLTNLLDKGPLIITFYRGGWCPYCNLELRAYQQHLAEIEAAGATLIAITPENPDASLNTKEKNEINFQILTDKNALYEKQLGLVFTLDESIRPIYQEFGIQLDQHNSEEAIFDLPIPATLVINAEGTITAVFADVDYTKRAEPSEVIAKI